MVKKTILELAIRTGLGRYLPNDLKGAICHIMGQPLECEKIAGEGVTGRGLPTFKAELISELDIPPRPCHFRELFIKSNGDVYPCCRVWMRQEMKIGHLTDPDLMDKIMTFNPPPCSCNRYSIRAISRDDHYKYELLNLELSLACQATCAMCCVNAPDWSGVYDYYNDISRLIKKMGSIDTLVVQGGEVLIQKKSLEFLENLKATSQKDTCFKIVSNANMDVEFVGRVENLFNHISISIVGFQQETYRKIMGLDLNKTIKFAETLIVNNKTSVSLKFLLTPLTVHELNLFLRWALIQSPKFIVIYDSGFKQYINENTEDKFWSKIIERTTKDVKYELLKCDLHRLRQSNTIISFQDMSQFGIDTKFIEDNGLHDIFKGYDT